MVMTEHEVFVAFATIIEEFTGVPASDVTPGANLADDLEIDSLSIVEIVVSVQDTFSVDIPDEDLRDLRTVQDVVSYVRRKQRSGVPG